MKENTPLGWDDCSTIELLMAAELDRRLATGALAAIVDELVRRNVYPATSVTGTPALKMVEGYGATWHEWRSPLVCQHCQSDLRDHENGPPFKREFAVQLQGTDRTAYFLCPDCKLKL